MQYVYVKVRVMVKELADYLDRRVEGVAASTEVTRGKGHSRLAR